MVIIAHRGWGARENTLAAFRQAIRLGADMIETDVRQSREGELILCHDLTLARIAGVRRHVSELTVEELRRYQVPTAREFLKLTTGKIRVNLELKPDPPQPALFFHHLLALIREFRLDRSILISSFSDRLLAHLRRLHPTIPIGCAVSFAPLALTFHRARRLRASVLCIRHDRATRRFITAAHTRSLKVYAYTVNTPAERRRLLRCGLDGIYTDRPTLLHK